MRKPEIDYILTTMLEAYGDISDLNVTTGKSLQADISGKLSDIQIKPSFAELTPFQTEVIALNLVGSDRRLCEMLIREGSCDSAYFLKGKARLRVNVFSQRSSYSIVLRKLETRIPTIDDLALPDTFHEITKEKNGLILVTGATGSGKSTSLAAILDKINTTRSVHIITLEDPVEFVHPHKNSTFNQRELGVDFASFPVGLRAALRQAPRVILIGEMRDHETIDIAMSAAETGHTVMSTLHTVDAGQTINRIIGMFDKDEENQVRIRLADTIRWIVCQRLLPKIGGGRIAAFEIMKINLRAKNAILNGESEGKTFYDIIEAGETFGMITFDNSILKLYKAGFISEEVAIAYASKKAVVSRGIDGIKNLKGEKTTDIHGLEIDSDYDESIKKNKNIR